MGRVRVWVAMVFVIDESPPLPAAVLATTVTSTFTTTSTPIDIPAPFEPAAALAVTAVAPPEPLLPVPEALVSTTS